MGKRLHGARLLLLAVGLASLGACRAADDAVFVVDVVGTDGAAFQTGSRLAPAGQLVRAATAEGLVGFDEQGRVIPALADRWIVTDDGLSYIFRLREGTWPDGSEMSGEAAARALSGAIAGLVGTALGQDLARISKVRAMAGRVIELQLEKPMPDLLQILAQPELGLFHKQRVGSGPFVLAQEGGRALLTPIPAKKLGFLRNEGPSADLRTVRLNSLPANISVKRFEEGATDVVLGGTYASFPTAQAASGLTRRVLRIDPVAGLFGLAPVSFSGPLADPGLRMALALAIDRAALQSAVASGAWAPTTRLIGKANPQEAGGADERWGELSVAQRQARAAAVVERLRARGGRSPALRLALPEGPGADLLFQRLASDFGAIGIPLQRVSESAPADLAVVDLVARYNRAEWYLQQFACPVRKAACSPAADSLLRQALAEPDGPGRGALLLQAEAAMLDATVYIPIGSPIRWALVRDAVTGFAVNPTGVHPLAALARQPK